MPFIYNNTACQLIVQLKRHVWPTGLPNTMYGIVLSSKTKLGHVYEVYSHEKQKIEKKMTAVNRVFENDVTF